MSNPAKFWDRIAVRYSKAPIKNEAAYEHKLKMTRGYFDTNMDVLEFGCGTGSIAIAHAPYVSRILAIDISSKMLEIAREKVSAANISNIEFEQAGINELTAPAESFDAVMGHSVLHLLPNKEEAIVRVREVLKPGGKFFSSTYCLGDSMKFLKYILPVAHFLKIAPLVRVFTKSELISSFTNNGFRIIYDWHPEKGGAEFIVAEKV